MFIVMLDYIQPLSEVDKHLADHQKYLQRQFENGTFLVSGPKEPRTGGVILASADSLETLQSTLALDPFHIHGIATYEVIQFTARASAPGLERLIGA